MTKTYFSELMEDYYGCHSVGHVAFGVRKGWPFSAEMTDDGSFELRFTVGGDTAALPAQLKAKKRGHIRWFSEEEAQPDTSRLTAVLDIPSDFYIKATLHTAFLDTLTALEEGGFAPPENCPLCQNGRCDSYACIDDGYRATHKACVQTLLDLPKEDKTTTTYNKGHFVTGALGALVGAFVGVAPNFSQALSAGKMTAVMYALVPVLSALLYRLFRGRKNRLASIVMVLAASFFAAFALELVWYWLVITNQMGYNLSFWQTSAFYFDTHTPGTAVREMLFSLLFLVAGFFPAAVLLRRYVGEGMENRVTVRGMDFVGRSLAPIRPPEPQEDEKAAERKDEEGPEKPEDAPEPPGAAAAE